MVYIVNYTLRGNNIDYSNLYSKIKELGDSYYQVTETLWFIYSDNSISVKYIVDSIKPYLSKQDLLFVCELPQDSIKGDALSRNAWDFIKSHETNIINN